MALATGLLILLKAVIGVSIGIFAGLLIVNLFYWLHRLKPYYPKVAGAIKGFLIVLTVFWFLVDNLPFTKSRLPYGMMWADNKIGQIFNPASTSFERVTLLARDSVSKVVIQEVKGLYSQGLPDSAKAVYTAFVKKWGPGDEEETSQITKIVTIVDSTIVSNDVKIYYPGDKPYFKLAPAASSPRIKILGSSLTLCNPFSDGDYIIVPETGQQTYVPYQGKVGIPINQVFTIKAPDNKEVLVELDIS